MPSTAMLRVPARRSRSPSSSPMMFFRQSMRSPVCAYELGDRRANILRNGAARVPEDRPHARGVEMAVGDEDRRALVLAGALLAVVHPAVVVASSVAPRERPFAASL